MSPLKSPLAEEIKALRGEREEKLPEGSASREALRKKRRIYLVTDTSWWLEEGWYKAVEIAEKANNLFFVIPGGVLKELDGLKKNDNQARRSKALYATKQIKELLEKGKGEIITNGKKKEFGCLDSTVDEEVISVAKALNKEGKNVIVLTTDYAQKAVAMNENLKCMASVIPLMNYPKKMGVLQKIGIAFLLYFVGYAIIGTLIKYGIKEGIKHIFYGFLTVLVAIWLIWAGTSTGGKNKHKKRKEKEEYLSLPPNCYFHGKPDPSMDDD